MGLLCFLSLSSPQLLLIPHSRASVQLLPRHQLPSDGRVGVPRGHDKYHHPEKQTDRLCGLKGFRNGLIPAFFLQTPGLHTTTPPPKKHTQAPRPFSPGAKMQVGCAAPAPTPKLTHVAEIPGFG
jgi:hypothetical protein